MKKASYRKAYGKGCGKDTGKVACRCQDCDGLSYWYEKELYHRCKPHCPHCGSTFLEVAPSRHKEIVAKRDAVRSLRGLRDHLCE